MQSMNNDTNTLNADPIAAILELAATNIAAINAHADAATAACDAHWDMIHAMHADDVTEAMYAEASRLAQVAHTAVMVSRLTETI